ncbi:MAG: hypothetical protein JRN45_00315 [Nitrososphaerota archaeon]|nr:hypothetical protein [Nitrososphaerota archaeon]
MDGNYAEKLQEFRRLMAKDDQRSDAEEDALSELSDLVVADSTPGNAMDLKTAEAIIGYRQKAALDIWGGYLLRHEKSFEVGGSMYTAVAFGCSGENEGKDALDGIIFMRRTIGGKVEQGPAAKARFSLDLVASLVLASCEEFRSSEIADKVAALTKAVPLELLDLQGKAFSSDTEIRTALLDLLDEGMHSGWIVAKTMRYSDNSRRDVPLRLNELLADDPSLKEPLDRILTHLGQLTIK